jgi:hypothetical protein
VGVRDLVRDLCCALHNSGFVFPLAADDLIEINSDAQPADPHFWRLSMSTERLSGNKAFIREDLMSYAGQG